MPDGGVPEVSEDVRLLQSSLAGIARRYTFFRIPPAAIPLASLLAYEPLVATLLRDQRFFDCFQKPGRRQILVRFDVMNNQDRRSKYDPFAGHSNLAVT
jgi:hypothetical protein